MPRFPDLNRADRQGLVFGERAGRLGPVRRGYKLTHPRDSTLVFVQRYSIPIGKQSTTVHPSKCLDIKLS